jgi:peroxiredoxin
VDWRDSSPVGRTGWLTLGAGALVGLAFGLMLFQARAPSMTTPPETSPQAAAVVDSPAPDFSLETLDGEAIRLSDLRGKVVALNFWATWCAPCRLEMPDLQARAEQHPDRLAVLGVDFDESPEEVAAFRDELGVGFPLLLDPGAEVQRLYRVLGYPTTFFIDEQGIIRFHHIGLMSEGQLDDYLSRLGLTA